MAKSQGSNRVTRYGEWPSRPLKETITDVLGLSMVFLLITFMFIQVALPVSSDFSDNVAVMRALGRSILEEFGWILGFYLTILLGFYVVTVTGQIRGTGEKAWQTSRTLGLYSTAIVGFTAPALLLSIVAAIGDVERVAKLMLVIPAYCVLVFLSISLGSYAVNDPKVQEKLAKAKLKRASRDLTRFRNRSTLNPLVVVFIPPAVLGMTLAVVAMLVHQVPFSWASLWLCLIFAGMSVAHAWIAFGSVKTYMKASSLMGKLAALFLPALFLLFLAFSGTAFAELISVRFAILWGMAGLIPLVSPLFPGNKKWLWINNWTLAGAASAYFYRKAEQDKLWASLQIESIDNDTSISQCNG